MVSKNNLVINFSIEHNDSLGQGVSKLNNKISFIPKTLPGEQGIAEIKQNKKGVSFAELIKLDQKSLNRVDPECPHFQDCGGCHYLHTDYENELEIKKSNLERSLKSYLSQLEIVPSPQRFSYRNRIQLHYDKTQAKLGFYKTFSKEIIEVPGCMIAIPEIAQKLNELYQNQSWLKLLKDQPDQGLVEIYHFQGNTQLAINQGHAHLGFTQVNKSMNHHLKEWVQQSHSKDRFTLELFGGDGNLSDFIATDKKLIVDQYPNPVKPPYISQNLYKKDALKNISKYTSNKNIGLILDPPRSGLKNLKEWINHFAVKELTYISCNPATFKRDIDSIKDQVKQSKILGFDLFPGTYHMEIASHFILH